MTEYNNQIETLLNKLSENKEYKLAYGETIPATCTKPKGLVSVVKENKSDVFGKEIITDESVLDFEFPSPDIAKMIYIKVSNMK